MIVYKHGKLPRAPKLGYNVKCSNCGCEFFVGDDELVDRNFNGNALCNCPDCDYRIKFKRKV
jgi:DNA-directed RNA polymerase subunit RPC12/RpoP